MQDHVKHVINEIVGKYRVDGIHLDYVRFPDSSYSYDTESRVAYLKADDEGGPVLRPVADQGAEPVRRRGRAGRWRW